MTKEALNPFMKHIHKNSFTEKWLRPKGLLHTIILTRLFLTRIGQDVDIGDVLVKEGWGTVLEEPAAPAPIVPPDTPMPAFLPPTFGDLESSR